MKHFLEIIRANIFFSSVINVGVIAGSVVGGLAGLAILIGVIVCCCVAASRSSRSPGVIIQPMNSNAQSIVLNSTAFSHGQSTNPGPPYGHAANPYGLPPPGYVPYDNFHQGRADPAYPPPSASKY
ncbi:hypothetical protein CHS0354_016481 [Potamilus streckersoni]|uniref:Uncharacterized protein n=1 Tax=Potamilus streckersoni TaxID=2493646 RepID=A0AAE0WES5_9BIVA|nr:hypothetical protein CHS0354_016481 [Potamilus streckersoni]